MKPYSRAAIPDLDVDEVYSAEQEDLEIRYAIENPDEDPYEYDHADYDYNCPCCDDPYEWEQEWDVNDWIQMRGDAASISREDMEKYPEAMKAFDIVSSKLWRVLE